MNTIKHLLLATLLLFISGVVNAQEENSVDEPISQAELEQILAPIALYPDTVLSHILVATTYPLEVIQAERWTVQNPDLQGSEAVEAVNDKDWDPSVRALVAFPQILKRLSEDLEWTQRLGDAFLQDEEKLLAGVQSLRQKAYTQGSLDEMDKVSVTHEDDSIIIEPIEREVVYVPYYDTRVVYGPWHWSRYPPVYWNYPYRDYNYTAHHHSPFYWGPRIHLSFGFFFSSFHWGNHHLIRIPYHHYRPRRYYNHHQIVKHHQARRWAHNPNHRRGVAYRSVNVSNRYQQQNFSNRPGRADAYVNRNTVKTHDARTITRGRSPDRVRRELREGRINTHEPNNRVNRNRVNSNRVNSNRVNNSQVKAPGMPRHRPVANANQNNRRADSARPNNVPARPAARTNTPVRAPSVKTQRPVAPPAQRSAPPKQENYKQRVAKQEHKQSNAGSRSSKPARQRDRRAQPR